MTAFSAPALVLRKATEQPDDVQATILFAGDFFVSRDHVLENPDEFLGPEIRKWVRQSSFSVANFEGAVARSDATGISKDGPYLAMSERAPALLKTAGFQAVTLANNHAMDYGFDGLKATLDACAKCGLQRVGAAECSAGAMRPLSVPLAEDNQVQIFSLCEREFGVSEGGRAGTAWLTSPEAESAVEEAKQQGAVVIVCAHGGNELMPLPSSQRRRQLQRLIDAGADLVIGHHPHVPQAWERYKNSYIFYSLGDFYFDSTDGQRYDYRDWGFMVRAGIRTGRISSLEVVPYERHSGKIGALGVHRDEAAHISYLDRLAAIIASPQFDGYWQQLAVKRLSGYRSVFRSRFTYPKLSFRQRVRETLNLSHELLNVWRLHNTYTSATATQAQRAVKKEALGALNSVRCESHRWIIETAFSVLGGEVPDLRTPEIRATLRGLRSFYAYRGDTSDY